jgi:hypothetical protein
MVLRPTLPLAESKRTMPESMVLRPTLPLAESKRTMPESMVQGRTAYPGPNATTCVVIAIRKWPMPADRLPSVFQHHLQCQLVRKVDSQEECDLSHACSLQASRCGSNSIRACKSLIKTEHHACSNRAQRSLHSIAHRPFIVWRAVGSIELQAMLPMALCCFKLTQLTCVQTWCNTLCVK